MDVFKSEFCIISINMIKCHIFGWTIDFNEFFVTAMSDFIQKLQINEKEWEAAEQFQ